MADSMPDLIPVLWARGLKAANQRLRKVGNTEIGRSKRNSDKAEQARNQSGSEKALRVGGRKRPPCSTTFTFFNLSSCRLMLRFGKRVNRFGQVPPLYRSLDLPAK